MGTRDARVDAYIANAPEYAKPILEYLRATVHEVVPDVTEGIKWQSPHFDYKGMFCGMSAFKEYCVFGFWKSKLVLGDEFKSERPTDQLGRIATLADLPPKKKLVGYLKKAKELNDAGTKIERKPSMPKKPIRTPAFLTAALKKNKKAAAAYESFPPSHKREYLEWLTDAKTEETRAKRLAQAIEWMAEGKPRNWKYMR
jgi:uncharacterized protein YdeI (YjbR/CyaY-like superfamily)